MSPVDNQEARVEAGEEDLDELTDHVDDLSDDDNELLNEAEEEELLEQGELLITEEAK